MQTKARGRKKFEKHKKIIIFLCNIVSFFPVNIRKILYNLLRMTQGKKGLLMRYIFLKTLTKNCGDNVSVHPGVYLFEMENLALGKNISIHPMCYIDATGGITVGDDVSIAHGVTIMSTNHKFDDSFIPIKDQGVTSKHTNIGNNIWIGAKASILAGVSINDGSVIAAGAVVVNNINSNEIVGGVPAKKIKDRL